MVSCCRSSRRRGGEFLGSLVLPEKVLDGADGDRMFIPVDDDGSGWSQHVWNIDKDAEGKVTRTKLFGVRYVPLTDPPGL